MARSTQLSPPVVALAGLALGAVILGQAVFLRPDGIPAVMRLHDHTVHSIVYGALGAAVAWWSGARFPQRGAAYHLALVQLVALHLGLADEILQSTSLGREASPHDLVADCAGSFAGAVAVMALRRPALLRWTRRTALTGGAYVVALAVALFLGLTTPPARGAAVIAPMAPAEASSCGRGAHVAAGTVSWRLDVGTAAYRAALVEGWSVDERLPDRTATWSEGRRSRLEVLLPARAGRQRLVFVAMGAADPAKRVAPAAMVRLNGRRLGRLELGREFAPRSVMVPDDVLVAGVNTIELEHLYPFVPPGDGRELSLMLDEVCLDALP